MSQSKIRLHGLECCDSAGKVPASVKAAPAIASVSKKVVRAPRRISRDAWSRTTNNRNKVPRKVAVSRGLIFAARSTPATKRIKPVRYANQGYAGTQGITEVTF